MVAVASGVAENVVAEGLSKSKLPCIEQPAFRVFDHDGDGVLSLSELRAAAPSNARVQEIATALEANGLPGLRYTDCGEIADSGAESASGGDAISGEDIARIIARAAVSQLEEQG
jgi:Ca2+-binding EF-hand superfamily protein